MAPPPFVATLAVKVLSLTLAIRPSPRLRAPPVPSEAVLLSNTMSATFNVDPAPASVKAMAPPPAAVSVEQFVRVRPLIV